jgi:hypothetical protein
MTRHSDTGPDSAVAGLKSLCGGKRGVISPKAVSDKLRGHRGDGTDLIFVRVADHTPRTGSPSAPIFSAIRSPPRQEFFVQIARACCSVWVATRVPSSTPVSFSTVKRRAEAPRSCCIEAIFTITLRFYCDYHVPPSAGFSQKTYTVVLQALDCPQEGGTL